MAAVKVLALLAPSERRRRFVWGYVCAGCRARRLMPSCPFAYIVARARIHAGLCSASRDAGRPVSVSELLSWSSPEQDALGDLRQAWQMAGDPCLIIKTRRLDKWVDGVLVEREEWTG